MMEIEMFATALVALVALTMFLLRQYVQRLPEAPLCPACRSLTRASDDKGFLLPLMPSLATTFLGECGRCGWRGRMRWRYAPHPLRRREHG